VRRRDGNGRDGSDRGRYDALVSELAPGERVREDLVLVAPLGRGAMGEVWEARHLKLDTQVAVKFISADVRDAHAAEALARFQREARAAAQIKSPHIMQIFDTGATPAGQHFMVMELCEGETLRERLERLARLELAEVRAIATQIAKGLEAAHQVEVVHRDVKPDNVFLAGTAGGMVVKIFDFGIAKPARLPKVERLTVQGIMVGTPEYMSPEQVMDSRTVDYRADLWAFAVIVYEMLTGQVPFTGGDIGQLCGNLLRGRYRPPSELRGELPAALDGWFVRAFHREASQRFASAMEMARALVRAAPPSVHELEDALLGSGEHVVPPGIAEAATPRPAPAATFAGSTADRLVSPPASRRRLARTLGVVVTAGVAAGGVLAWLTGRSPGEEPTTSAASVTTAPSAPSPSAVDPAAPSAAPFATGAPRATASVETASMEGQPPFARPKDVPGVTGTGSAATTPSARPATGAGPTAAASASPAPSAAPPKSMPPASASPAAPAPPAPPPPPPPPPTPPQTQDELGF
jgi:serine/threonine-protein kinase